MYEVINKGYDKIKRISPVCLWLNVVMLQKAAWRKSFKPPYASWKQAVDGRLLLRFHDAVSACRKQHALQPLALTTVSVDVFHAVGRFRVHGIIVFCLVFSKDFNIMSAIFVRQVLTVSQKIDSREGSFWGRMGVIVNAGKMNFYLKAPPFAPPFGLFVAKYSAICR